MDVKNTCDFKLSRTQLRSVIIANGVLISSFDHQGFLSI